MLGFGPKLNTVFKSRWKAVGWAMGVLLTAYCTVPMADQARRHEEHKVAAEAARHKSPWAKD
ncbi:hypothetical protein [Novosphingobium sp.]|uniref:hypothetical protein n=1 Tax=Novosphingobium sp. TaxID=1874826 RepID=UPI0026125D72|nr:hypothetical protein [Novosphingobium sp.]HNN55017.1 hypothetical protein [Novosphingobium sp.]